MVCEKIGEPDPDVAGIGVSHSTIAANVKSRVLTDLRTKILVSFSVQTFVSLALSIWVFFLSKLGRLDVSHEQGSEEYKVELGRLRIISRCIMVGYDVQLLLGEYILYL
jgi:hypothetical protein